MNREPLATGEHYHIYNRGVDKREIFPNEQYVDRFLLCMQVFNSIDPILSLRDDFEIRAEDNLPNRQKLVEVVAYCLNPNHYHFIIRQLTDKGIEKFMHRLGTGYTNYFNEKHKCSGSLFQGRYKAIHIDSNNYLLHLSAYVNLNYEVHKLRSSTSQCGYKSSWDEYQKGFNGMCKKEIVLSQFKNYDDYRKFAIDAVKISRTRKDMEKLLLEQT